MRCNTCILGLLLALNAGYAFATFSGDGTYYGNNGWAGSCAGQMPPLGKTWPPRAGAFGINVALNHAQYSTGMCGKRIMFRGTGAGIGGTPVKKSWQQATITNECPECKRGDIDLGIKGDGRWRIEWYFVDGSGANSVQVSSASRALVPKHKKSSGHSRAYQWKKWLKMQRAKRAAARRAAHHKGRKLLLLTKPLAEAVAANAAA